ncbi:MULTISPECIES: lysozyme inhibitor LprI family protein [Psychrilyobacter]|uniref:DUF1311 domain-containing protein n=1 Tax=Psychrilyobacter piezotolerans TaxID=2293438 RepID=A0ABX9KJK2_9FUSO|nr:MULTISPECIES: lysozyme inhibitor LprI family protein [Psychrilyobacter]MCS5422776.1 lysozyme inhibitor LprI family protein [Psychrilyobacter sp. S5]NDI76937.1 DUF1311 domain-containing protein [Psychrilyobacter piezotolerans]RDE64561.1 DUF1311 domain-containing protein [Psychrilyobacter sp. S5]REI42373.1 DUF1311 domain-containing protein [Psychrilyobacter piezotolerans]
MAFLEKQKTDIVKIKENKDVIQIREIKERNIFNKFDSEISFRLRNIKNLLDEANKLTEKEELLRYIPVSLIALIEGSIRLCIKELIDCNEEYFYRSEKLITKKLDFSILGSLNSKKITTGEFISHLVSINRIGDIDNIFTSLLGEKFFLTLKEVKNNYKMNFSVEEDESLVPDSPIIKDFSKVKSDISKCFDLRHILAHEIASNLKLSYIELVDIFQSVSLFLKGTVEIILNITAPSLKYTQFEMNKKSKNDLDLMEEIMNVTINEILNEFKDSCPDDYEAKKKFLYTQTKWKEYALNASKLEALKYKGGSIQPMIYAIEMASRTRKRIEELEKYKND